MTSQLLNRPPETLWRLNILPKRITQTWTNFSPGVRHHGEAPVAGPEGAPCAEAGINHGPRNAAHQLLGSLEVDLRRNP